MPERYVDQLRRITRQQSQEHQLSAGQQDVPEPPPAPRWRYAPLLVVLVVASLVAVGWLLMQQMAADSKLQDCVMSGRKNCAPLEETAP